MTVAALGILKTTRPVSGRLIGYRIKLAVPNQARYDVLSGEYRQSFAPKFLIAESGDYSEPPTMAQMEAFLGSVMKWNGITELVVH